MAGPTSSARQAIPTTVTTVSSHIQSIAGADHEGRKRTGSAATVARASPVERRSRLPAATKPAPNAAIRQANPITPSSPRVSR